jgi:hypothetical protein
MKVAAPPTGRKIVLELEREMEDRLYPLFYRTLPPAEYHVYLHPADYKQIEAIVPLIVGDGQRHLNDRVERLNRRPRWSLLGEKPAPIEIPPGGWTIFIHPAANDEIAPGELGIVSRLAIPVAPAFEGGTPTVRIGRTVVTETIRRTTMSDEPAAPAGAPSPSVPSVPPVPAVTVQTQARTETARIVDRTVPAGFATLTYVDEDGPHLFTMRKASISIGRGGDAHWVDMQVTGSPRISREHCRIRRDGAGEFFLDDVSTWGTSVDGVRVEPSTVDAAASNAAAGHRLPRQARIELADTLVIEFNAHTGQ